MRPAVRGVIYIMNPLLTLQGQCVTKFCRGLGAQGSCTVSLLFPTLHFSGLRCLKSLHRSAVATPLLWELLPECANYYGHYCHFTFQAISSSSLTPWYFSTYSCSFLLMLPHPVQQLSSVLFHHYNSYALSPYHGQNQSGLELVDIVKGITPPLIGHFQRFLYVYGLHLQMLQSEWQWVLVASHI